MNQLETTWNPADHTVTPCCGIWSIHCRACRKTVMVTAAGFADDPRSVRIGCQGGAR